MEQSIQQTRSRARRAQRRALWFISILLLAVICAAAGASFMVLRSAESTLSRDVERALSTQAQQRVATLTVWFGTLQSQVKNLTDGDVLRLFATEVAATDEDLDTLLRMAQNPPSAAMGEREGDAGESAQLAAHFPLMRRLLSDFVERAHFLSARLLDAKLRTYMSTAAETPPLTSEETAAAGEVLRTGEPVVLPARLEGGRLFLRLLYPVYPPLYMAEGDGKPLAVLVLDDAVTDVVGRMTVPTGTEREAESGRLLQRTDSGVQELLPEPGAAPRPLPGWSAGESGGLPMAVRVLADGTPVYSLALGVPGLPWMVEEDVTLESAQAAYRDYRRNVILLAVGGTLMAALLLGMVWWWLLGRGERAVAQELSRLYHTVNRQKQLLDGINGALADGIVLKDAEGRLQYVNNAFAAMAGKTPGDMIGLTCEEALGSEVARRIGVHTDTAIKKRASALFTEALNFGKGKRHYQVACSPYREENGETTGVVSVYRDITDLVAAQEHAQSMVHNTINVLVRAIEAVDPYLRGQSTRTGQLARVLAQRMGLGAAHESTVRAAANLSQIGMIQLPRTLLAKAGALTDEERAQLERHVDYARAVLEGIDFGLPVLPAIYQMHERMDGSGYPQGLAGDAIAMDARILGVANTFCALVRPRSYREARSVEEALRILSETPPKYDPQIVEALREFLGTPAGSAFLNGLIAEGE